MTFARQRNLLRWSFGAASALTTVCMLALFVCLCSFRGNLRLLFASLLAIDVGLLLLTVAVRSILTGELAYGRSGLWQEIDRRTEDPRAFWRTIWVLALASVGLLALGGTSLVYWN